MGQLGLGESVMERKKPALVPIPEDVVQAEAGGMHTVCLSRSGQVGLGLHRTRQILNGIWEGMNGWKEGIWGMS